MSYHEVQRFRQPWLWCILVIAGVGSLSLLTYGMYKQLILGQPWGERPLSDNGLMIVGCLASLFFFALFYLLYRVELTVEVHEKHLSIRFSPFSRRIIDLKDIVSFEARTYRPILEYGGWGIRYSWKGMAYNVSGNRGVQLELSSGKRVLIGSQRPEELVQTMEMKKR